MLNMNPGKRCPRCGETKMLEDFPRSRHTKSGYAGWCKVCNAEKSKAFRYTPSGIYTQIKSRSKFRRKRKKYHKVNISREKFISWYNSQPKNCIYCDIPEADLTRLPDEFNNRSPRLTVDCKNSVSGYSLDNMVLACWRCNIVKGNILTFDEMMYVGQNFIKPKWEKMRRKNHALS